MASLPLLSVEAWILLVTFIVLFVMYGYSSYGVLEKLGIPCSKPRMYTGTVFREQKVYYLGDLEDFQKYGRIWGMYELKKPILAVMDPEMLKTILVKECFTYFTNRTSLGLLGDLYDSVAFAEDDQWRRIRNVLTPIFTSGRMKEMFSIMKHHSHKVTDKLRAHVDDVISVRDYFGPYSLDVLMGCAFSVDLDLINNPNSPIFTHARNLFRIPIPLFFLHGCFPFLRPLLKRLGFSFLSKTSTDFFGAFVEKLRAERNRSSQQESGDMFQHMIDSQRVSEPNKETQHAGLTDHEILTQATMFVFAGFETSASTLYLLAYSLATNPEVLKRLQEEIDSTFPNKGSVDYDRLMQMEYLNCVVNECLRLYPAIPRLDRMAKETIKVKGITIVKDMSIMIPVYALHRDPELWPEPEEFNPDRFNKENKQSINPYAYLPFGTGPRNCLGLRFAMVMVKLALVEVLQNFSFSVCEETEIPLQMATTSLVGPLRPIKLKLLTRSTTSENVD